MMAGQKTSVLVTGGMGMLTTGGECRGHRLHPAAADGGP